MADAAVGLRKLAQDLSAASGQSFTDVAADLVASAANQVQVYAQQYAPVRTGTLRGSISTVAHGLTATVSTHTPYARFVEYGTGTRGEFPGSPIVIRPRKAQYLRFVGRDGRVVYTKRVVSPGMAPRPYMRPAAERIAVTLTNTLGSAAVLTIVRGPQAPQSLSNPVA